MAVYESLQGGGEAATFFQVGLGVLVSADGQLLQVPERIDDQLRERMEGFVGHAFIDAMSDQGDIIASCSQVLFLLRQ